MSLSVTDMSVIISYLCNLKSKNQILSNKSNKIQYSSLQFHQFFILTLNLTQKCHKKLDELMKLNDMTCHIEIFD